MIKTIFSSITKRNIVIHRKMSSLDTTDVILEEINNKGIITLNRPKVLNALNLSMVQKIVPALKKWESENKTCVIVKGAGGKAFCAGGDVKNIVLDGMKGGKMGQEFFREEYTMNGIIGNYKLPYIAFIDGIVMGGGVGLSVHGKHRIATERSVFAMPETQIGLFPDVGGSYFLPRLTGKLGTYLALTGERLKGSELLKAGIATHFTDSSKLEELEKELLKCGNSKDIEKILEKFNIDDGKPFRFDSHLNKINHCFSAKTIEGVIENLKGDDSEWGRQTAEILRKMSPTSLKVTLRILEEGAKLNLIDALRVEYRVSVACLSNHDFFEGVRALLIDKDQKPHWKPDRIDKVSDEIVRKHFEKLPEDQELKHKL